MCYIRCECEEEYCHILYNKNIYIYYRYHHIYISPKSVIGFFGSFVYVIVIVNFKCAMKNELPEINMRGQNLCYS
jgi:hypothetical protein